MKPAKFYLAALFSIVMLISGCGEGDTGSNIDQAALDAAQANWRNQGIETYSMKYTVTCFCGGGSASIEVVNELLSSADFTGGNEEWQDQEDSEARTATQLFDIVQDALNRAYKSEITFHSNLGYPTKIDVTWEDNFSNDAYVLEVTSLSVSGNSTTTNAN